MSQIAEHARQISCNMQADARDTRNAALDSGLGLAAVSAKPMAPVGTKRCGGDGGGGGGGGGLGDGTQAIGIEMIATRTSSICSSSSSSNFLFTPPPATGTTGSASQSSASVQHRDMTERVCGAGVGQSRRRRRAMRRGWHFGGFGHGVLVSSWCWLRKVRISDMSWYSAASRCACDHSFTPLG